jgi:hypothetical protein
MLMTRHGFVHVGHGNLGFPVLCPVPACQLRTSKRARGIAHSHSGRTCALQTALLTRRLVHTGVRIATSSMVLEYTNGSAPFGPSTLSVQLLEPNLMNKTVWRWGDSTEGNLYGTFHTYDQLNGFQVISMAWPTKIGHCPQTCRASACDGRQLRLFL